ncbi:type VI secretion system tube protein Hcp [Bordetella genomosp. 8]|nr:type VI secretion system tube protein Hcp [Bordetella genomosp. 8]
MSDMDYREQPIRWTGDFGKDIPGASELAGAEKQVDLFHANYQSGNAGRLKMGGQMRPGSVVYSDVVVSKPTSAATPKLASAFDKRLEVPEITIYQYTRDGESKPTIAEKWTLSNCYIIDFQPGSVGGVDNFAIDYKRIMIDTFEVTDDGTLKPTGTRGYDRVTHEAL